MPGTVRSYSSTLPLMTERMQLEPTAVEVLGQSLLKKLPFIVLSASHSKKSLLHDKITLYKPCNFTPPSSAKPRKEEVETRLPKLVLSSKSRRKYKSKRSHSNPDFIEHVDRKREGRETLKKLTEMASPLHLTTNITSTIKPSRLGCSDSNIAYDTQKILSKKDCKSAEQKTTLKYYPAVVCPYINDADRKERKSWQSCFDPNVAHRDTGIRYAGQVHIKSLKTKHSKSESRLPVIDPLSPYIYPGSVAHQMTNTEMKDKFLPPQVMKPEKKRQIIKQDPAASKFDFLLAISELRHDERLMYGRIEDTINLLEKKEARFRKKMKYPREFGSTMFFKTFRLV